MTENARRWMFYGTPLIIVTVLVALLFFVMKGATICGGPEMRLLNSGVIIYRAVFVAAVDAEATGDPSPWPLQPRARRPTSTDT